MPGDGDDAALHHHSALAFVMDLSMVSSHLPSGVQSGEAITVDTGEAFGNDFSFVDLIEPGGAQSENTGKVQKFSSPILREFETGLGGGCNAHDEADLEKFNVGFSTNNTGDVNAPSVGPTPTSPCHGVAQDIPASSSPDLRCNIGVCLKEAILMLLPSQCPEWKQFFNPSDEIFDQGLMGELCGASLDNCGRVWKEESSPFKSCGSWSRHKWARAVFDCGETIIGPKTEEMVSHCAILAK